MNNHSPRVGLPPDTNLRAHDVRTCGVCSKPVHMPGRNWKHCSYDCRRIGRYRALGKEPPAPKVKEKNQPALPANREAPVGWIEARIAWWAAYHKRNRTYRITSGWDGGRSSLLGGDV